MLELFEKFSFPEILTFIILLAIAFKSVVSFLDWFQEKVGKILHFKTRKAAEKEKNIQRLLKNTEMIEQLIQKQAVKDEQLKDLSNRINLLIESDKDDIKSYITREHHRFCYELKEIDDFSLDCLEKRYKHYAEQGGNSFIQGFMQDLRKLPKQYHK